jgi:uncharacterized membrane protein YkvI
VQHGAPGIITPLIAMIVTGGVIYYMTEYARSSGTQNYRPFALKCFGGKAGQVMSVLYDITFLLMVLCAGGLALSGEGNILLAQLKIPYFIGISATVLVSGLLCLYGSKLLAISSKYMMYAIIAVVLDSREETRKAIASGYVITVVLMIAFVFTLFSYSNVYDICAESVPVMWVLQNLGYSWLTGIYVLLMTLAVLSTTAGLANAGCARFNNLFTFIKNVQLRRIVMTVILLGIAALGASFGMANLMRTGTSLVGYIGIPVLVIPAFTWVRAKLKKEA